ncbi:hypothetical protein [Methylacidimicrobium sp. B4]|uniref:hypothetical protein n=1 Tax=Methylacidimicrobium sp. B4 TaxID=2796139 RepID=UPI001A8C1577|nr:hypothetical protein [Methylacidimicrobium sp. B4]QSR84808.1 hypothetical protein MacB4_00535 [Methylacidimicrobium sp. B4]
MCIAHRGKAKRITQQERKLLKRRQATHPIIDHPAPCAAGNNIMWLLHMIAKKGVLFLGRFLRLWTALSKWYGTQLNTSGALQSRSKTSASASWAALGRL